MSRLRAIALTICVVALTSLAFVLAKLSLREVAPFTFVWLQIAIGGGALTLYTFAWRGERIPRGLGREVWLYIIWIGLANFAVVRTLFIFALERLPATTSAYLTNFTGVVTMLLSVVMLRERPSLVQVTGALLALAGLRVFFREIPAPAELTGVVYLAIAVTALASTNNVARKLALVAGGRVSSNVVSTVALWIGGGPVVLAGLLADSPAAVAGWESWAIIALNGLLSIAVGLTVWNHVLHTLRSYEASVLGASAVIFAALFAVPVLGERLEWHEITGIAMMLAGLALAQIRGRLRRSRGEP